MSRRPALLKKRRANMLFGLKGEIKDIDKKARRVTGYASTFGVVDSGNDIVESGAFRRTIEAWGPAGKNRIKALYQHDPSWLVGRPLKLEEDDRGLLHETQFSDTAVAKDTLTLIEDKVITEQSIGYDVIVRDVDDNGIRHLRELRLYEYSFVTWGMNELTPITGVKALRAPGAVRAQMDRLEKALKNNRFDSEDVPMLMQVALAHMKELIDSDIVGTPPAGDIEDAETFETWITDNLKVLSGLSAKEGRILSARNQTLVQEAIEALRALLEAADPGKSTLPAADSLEQLAKDLKESASNTRVESLQKDLQLLAHQLKGS
jgi:hypothetical protein